MAESYASIVIAAPARRVWQWFGDFGGLAQWHPGIAELEMEDGAGPREVGAVRRLWLGDGTRVRERLVALDEVGHSHTYEMLEGPFPIRSYRATVRVRPVTATGESFAEWWARYDADAEREAELDRTFAEGVFATGLAELARRHAEI
ncbi:SRPBCC family protein [Actinopolyspora mortivallis]|uniref:SRPBCC family protein n=1 Tax=Actinopolyspora mortivallis TaxID=33906 RepID=UPI00037BBB3F|nr:SRPBCC family protein [Actinopolyspora mortivallis]